MHHYEEWRPTTEPEHARVACLGCGYVAPTVAEWAGHLCELPILSCSDVDDGVNG